MTYAKIINEQTKEVSIGLGTDTEFYKSIGMEEMEVEQSYDGQWYVKGYAPSEPIEDLKAAKLAQINTWTASKITGGFLSGGVRYDSDMETQTTMQGIALNVNTERFATNYPHGIPVRGYDEGSTEKTIHYLTAEEVLMFCADLSEHIGRCKLDGWTMQQAVLEATTKEELEAIILD